MTATDPQATDRTRSRYQRISPFYDLMGILPERYYSPWRRQLWGMLEGDKVLEVGVGTGKNIPFYPHNADVFALDLTAGMLARARRKLGASRKEAPLFIGDVQSLSFPDNTFDAVVATFVFCSVPDPILGLGELKRVVKPGGQILLLEHVRSGLPILGALMDRLDPWVAPWTGVHINRRTVENVKKAGLKLERVVDFGRAGIFKRIHAQKTVGGRNAKQD